MAAAASEGASSGDANDDAGPGRDVRAAWVPLGGLRAAAPGWAASVASDANS